tara:strand:+ start:2796 stop:3302 length:507 start_codon:yes stop_codon:yes gene_type:complete
MEQNANNSELKDKIASYLTNNTGKIYIFGALLILIVVSTFIMQEINKKRNEKIAEKYIQANFYLNDGKKDLSKKIYKEIIESKNNFYSILALNTIIEKNLEFNEEEILEYFEIVEPLNKQEEQKNILILKKALYLIKIKKVTEGENLLKKLVEKDVKLKSVAQEILKK